MRHALASIVALGSLSGAPLLEYPLSGALVRAFEAPTSAWGPGHRGIDLAASHGTSVRAAAAGVVVFAGDVADVAAVTVDHGNGLQTTYSDLSNVTVSVGEVIDAGHFVGAVGTAHRGVPGLHFGVKLNGEYVDPSLFLGPLDISAAVHLAPVAWVPPDVFPDAFARPFRAAGTHAGSCAPIAARPLKRAPNDNLVVAVAGIGSRTSPDVDAEIYEHGPSSLGYPEERVFRFSYEGARGPELHEPYRSLATFGDLGAAARRLESLLRAVARRHPGRGVDLVAHSQGGIVARTYLTKVARSWDPELPRIEHLVTFATPHSGAPLAKVARRFTTDPRLGGVAMAALSRWARAGGPIPDPYAPAVAQLAPGSPLLTALAREDVVFGTRVLALGIPNDPVVPAQAARMDGASNVTVPWAGLPWGGHEAIVSSPVALAAAHRFLRDGAPICSSRWDGIGTAAGGALSFLESRLGS
ncbi:MAG: peptidoglycan DD-metalloendopeptidase family protein [Actinomycetota bacterium]|nr:peptidoglycan DD-metalloendopeptidase family protein [Actinomycetota bacterium]